MEAVYRVTLPNVQEVMNLKQHYSEELKFRKLTVAHLLKYSPTLHFIKLDDSTNIPLAHILNQINLFHTFLPFSFFIQINITYHLRLGLAGGLFPPHLLLNLRPHFS